MSGVRPELATATFTSAWPFLTRKRTAPVDPARTCSRRPELLGHEFHCREIIPPTAQPEHGAKTKEGPDLMFLLAMLTGIPYWQQSLYPIAGAEYTVQTYIQTGCHMQLKIARFLGHR